MTSLVINNVEISTDEHGRYSLNDLHKAAGSSIASLPNKFMRQESVKNVIAVLNAQNRAFEPVSIKRGRYTGGSWVCKELVYKYAMWVDAEFEVKVIQTFDEISRASRSIGGMQKLNDLVAQAELANAKASIHASGLAKHKSIKKQNAIKISDEIESIQLKLGFAK